MPLPRPTLTRRQIYRRRRITVFSSLAVVLTGLFYGLGTGLAPVPAVAASLTQPPALTQPAAAPAWPSFGDGAIGAVGYAGVLASNGDQGPVPIASITKMVTALVILQAKPLGGSEDGPDITFTDKDVDYYYDALAEDGSVAPVVAGMVLNERQALTAMLLPSANNYSHSLAVWAYGSEDAYLGAAAGWLKDEGLIGTTVADTSGISPDSVSTPTDLVALGKLVVADPVLSAIVAQPTADLPTIGTVTNTNKLLGKHGVDGIKTGTTDEAGACLLFSADFTVGTHTITLVGVVLGGDTHPELNSAIADLIDSVEPGFREVTLTEPGTVYGSYTTAWGQTARAVSAKAASAVVWSDTPVTGAASAKPVPLADKGDTVGSVDFAVGASTVSVPLVLDRTLSDPGFGWRLGNPGKLSG
ncbi:D-alanyl-D-alanine carboxypeptidase family protein [Glaciibacter sp. 2TAF33]|uniref:D-alanyl-D-alanine carboxypeptidase family protein n=1 Tax=Glaciibacter sp. 2TAF33 TaxID=3233015 RepID=UPI003F8DD1CB